MSIKALALELYRAQQKVIRLEKEFSRADIQDKDRIKEELKAADAERVQLRKMLDGAKAPNPLADKSPRSYRR